MVLLAYIIGGREWMKMLAVEQQREQQRVGEAAESNVDV